MEGKQLVVQRVREYFMDQLEEAAAMVRKDREALRGWQEPAHLRAVARRPAPENAMIENGEDVCPLDTLEFGRTAGEPDLGQQREAVGQLLEAGILALGKLGQSSIPDLDPAEVLGLECVLLFYARPAVQINQGRLDPVCSFWSILEGQREEIEMCQRGVGRIELFGHPDYDWAGTGFLVNETTLLTTRRTAELFMEHRAGTWQFRPGISGWMNYRASYQRVASAGYRVRSVIGVHEQYDLALLETEPPQATSTAPSPLALAAHAPETLEDRPVYLISYPVRDARRSEPEAVARIFRDTYNVKRIQPGRLRGCLQFRDVQLLQHDCASLGQTSGGCLVDLQTHQVLGLHLSGRYLETGTAIPLWVLREDPLLQRAGVIFASACVEDIETTIGQIERLARSRYWTEAQATVGNLYRRAFGSSR